MLLLPNLVHLCLLFRERSKLSLEFLDFVLEQYVVAGVGELSRSKLPQLLELKYGAVGSALQELSDAVSIGGLYQDFQQRLYEAREVA